MKHSIHTAPVLDALANPAGCAFCAMLAKLEADWLQFMLGPAYMEDTVRLETDRTGFCARHLKAMYGQQNRLGLALMLHTHTKKLGADLRAKIQAAFTPPLFGRDPNSRAARVRAHLARLQATCYLCDKVNSTFELYTQTFFYLWQKQGPERDAIRQQAGYCLPHTEHLLAACNKMPRRHREEFADMLLRGLDAQMAAIEGDLDWFTQKFDHRNADAPWKNSKDALPRAIHLLGGTP